VSVLALVAGCETQSEKTGHSAADAVYRNGRTYTVDPENPWAESVAIKDGRFIKIGSQAGMVGGKVCRILAESGRKVRALVRNTSNPEKVARLKGLGAEVVQGDLKDPASLAAACRCVITERIKVSPDGRTFDSTVRNQALGAKGEPAEGGGEAKGRATRTGL
jgi:hypothetical protein